jgi:hypothetical protein
VSVAVSGRRARKSTYRPRTNGKPCVLACAVPSDQAARLPIGSLTPFELLSVSSTLPPIGPQLGPHPRRRSLNPLTNEDRFAATSSVRLADHFGRERRGRRWPPHG